MGLSLDEKGILVSCPACEQRNRLPFATLGKEVRCGKCKAPLPPASATVQVGSDAQFDTLVKESRLPVLIDFWAEWCGPCKMVAPELEKVAARTAGKVIVAKVNTEELPGTAGRFRIAGIPTMALMFDGMEINRISGARPASGILEFIDQNT